MDRTGHIFLEKSANMDRTVHICLNILESCRKFETPTFRRKIQTNQHFAQKQVPHDTRHLRGRTPLHFASNSEIAEMLIVAGADVNAKARGSTPLHNAAYRGLKEIVELLIAKGANINPMNNQGKSALDEAIK